LLAGGLLYFNESVGIAVEIGPSYHHFSHEVDLEGSDPDFELDFWQTNFNIGVAFKL
jgi:hypothetical protein